MLVLPPVDPVDQNLMGMNVDFTGDYWPSRPFADAVRQSRSWRTIEDINTDLGQIDSNGWPLKDAQLPVWHGLENMNGKYALSFEGKAEVRVSCCAGSVSNLKYDSGKNLSTATVDYDTTSGVGLFLAFENTRRTASSAINTGVSNVKLMRPIEQGGNKTYAPGTEFTTPFLDSLRRFSVLRFMDWLATNWNYQEHWGDRVTPAYYSQAVAAPASWAGNWQGRGASYESAIDLCNALDKDCWLNIPVLADDDYVLQLAKLIKARLEPDRKVYIEYSNELWNWGFAQYGQNTDLAMAEVNAGGSPLDYDGMYEYIVKTQNQGNAAGHMGARRTAKRGMEISLIFRNVFGDAAMMSRVRPMLMTQAAGVGASLTDAIQMMQDYYNNPLRVAEPHPLRYYFYGLGGAAYYAPAKYDNLNAVFHDFTTKADFVPTQEENGIFAAVFGVPHVAYEGGPEIPGYAYTGPPLSDAFRHSILEDPRIKGSMVAAHDTWSQTGGGLLMYFSATGDSPWGFVRDIWDDKVDSSLNLKMQAIDELNTRTRAKSTLGVALPATIAASTFVAPYGWAFPHDFSGKNPQTYNMFPGVWYGYVVRNDAAKAKYRITLSAMSSATARVSVSVDGNEVAKVDVPKSTAYKNTAPISVSLSPGTHGIIIQSISGTTNLDTIKVAK